MDDDIYDAMRGVHEELLGSKFHRAMCLFIAHILNIIWCHISITILEWHSMISTVKNISIRDINVQYTLSNILRNSPWMHKSYAHISREAESWQKWRRAEMITKCIMVWQHFCNKLRSVCYASATYLHIYLPLFASHRSEDTERERAFPFNNCKPYFPLHSNGLSLVWSTVLGHIGTQRLCWILYCDCNICFSAYNSKQKSVWPI